jgi:hypothetical protein
MDRGQLYHLTRFELLSLYNAFESITQKSEYYEDLFLTVRYGFKKRKLFCLKSNANAVDNMYIVRRVEDNAMQTLGDIAGLKKRLAHIKAKSLVFG